MVASRTQWVVSPELALSLLPAVAPVTPESLEQAVRKRLWDEEHARWEAIRVVSPHKNPIKYKFDLEENEF